MKTKVDLQELAVVLVAKNHNPTILNPDFLKFNDIVPRDWELASPPICAELIAQVSFRSGLSVVAQLDKVIITENLAGKDANESMAPSIAIKYVDTLPHVDYHAVGINPKGHVIRGKIEESNAYILDKFITPGPWKNFGGKIPSTRLNFSYPTSSGLLTLAIESGLFSPPNAESVPATTFGCNIHRDLVGATTRDKVSCLKKAVEGWKEDIDTYRTLVNDIFLA